MPRLFQKRSGTWVEIKSIFQKQGGTWVEILNIFQKIGGTWTRVFAGLKIPGNTVAPTITGTGYLFSTLTNTNLGTWTNTPTGYSRQWRRGNPSAGGGEPSGYSNISGATSSTYVTTSADNGKYIICQVTATNAVGDNSAASNSIYISKYAPVSLLPYTISGSPTVGSTLTAFEQIGSWKNTTTNTGDTYPDSFEYEWSYTDGTVIQSSTFSGLSFPRNVNSSTLVVTTADLNKQIRVAVKGINTGGEATSNFSTATATVTQQYKFSFGNVIYVSSNGHIGLDSGGSGYTSMSSGRNISIFVKDLQQYYLAEWSDSTVYYLYFKGYLYNTSASSVNALDYQIKFYTDPSINYCDVYVVRKGSSVGATSDIAPGYYASGSTGYSGMVGPYVIGAGTVFRVYFDGTAATTSGIPWTAVSENAWDVIQTWTGQGAGGLGVDDTFTAVTSAANQSAPFPANISSPTLTTDTGNFSAGSTITINAGSWTNANSFQYELLYGSSTPIATDSTAIKTLINTNQYVITNSDSTNPSFYFRGRVTGYSGTGQTGNSAIALSTTSSRATLNPTTTISVGTATSTGFTVSGTAGPLTGFGGTYVNLTSIQIFNSSFGLVATITSGLPAVNGTTGGWSYVWTGGSSSTTYYAKATVAATDTSQTIFTTGFSSSITTSAGVSTPTALTAAVVSGDIRLTFSGGSGDQFDVFYQNSSTRPTDGQAFADFPNVTSPYNTGLTARGSTRWFWVRRSSGTLRSNWFPSDSSVSARIPLLAPPTPVITNSAQSSNSLSWHWTEPTPSSTQDSPSSWDYALTTSTSSPTSGITNTTTRPTSASPITTSGLSVSTTYYMHVRAKNADATGSWTFQSGTTTAAPFVTPAWNGTMPAWAATGANGSNFRRLTSSLQYGWNNGTFSFSGSVGTSRGWDFYVSTTQPATTTTVRTPTNTLAYSETTSGTQIFTTSFIYRVNPTYTASPVYGSIRPYQFGTDGNKYVRGTQPNGTWSASI